MRISESTIKAAISHPDIPIQVCAANYFKNSFSTDPEIATLILNQLSDDGIEFDQIGLINKIANLYLTDENIGTLIKHLSIEPNGFLRIRSGICKELIRTDRNQFLDRYQEIIDSRNFNHAMLDGFKRRKELLAYDELRCWKELEDYCMQRTAYLSAISDEDVCYVELELAWCFADAIVRLGWNCEERILSILSQDLVDNKTENGMDATGLEFLQDVAVYITGLLKMESMVPILVSRMCKNEDSELLEMVEVESLIKIGTPEVVDLIARNYPVSNEEFQFHSKDILENIKTDHACNTCRQLLAIVDKLDCRYDLAEAMLNHFETDAIEFGRELVLANKQDVASEFVRESLIQCCTIMDQSFPEFDEVLNMVNEDGHGDGHDYEYSFDGGFGGGLNEEEMMKMFQPQNDYFSSQPMTDVGVSTADQSQIPIAGKTFKAGRNDSCPCGSGKKFKKCCMNHG